MHVTGMGSPRRGIGRAAALLDRPVANVPPRLFPDGRAGIGDATRQGQEVLALIAEDRTDRQIAGPLFISPRTVAIHVSSIPAGRHLRAEHRPHRARRPRPGRATGARRVAHPDRRAAHPAQVSTARQAAEKTGTRIETATRQPSGAQLKDGAVATGLLIALAVLAMTAGLVRAETASDLRTLTTAGAGPGTRPPWPPSPQAPSGCSARPPPASPSPRGRTPAWPPPSARCPPPTW